MRIATLNLWGRSGAWADRRRVLVGGFAALEPDVVALQEAEDPTHAAEVLGPEFEVVHRGWIAVASRRPLGAVRELALPPMPRAAGFPAATLLVEVDGPEPLLLVNHFPPWAPEHEAERELHTLAAARLIEEVAGERHVVLAGDLDATPDASSIRFLRGRQALDGFSVRYRDAWAAVHPGEPGHTFTPRNPLVMEETDVTVEEPRRIDYVFVRAGRCGPTLEIADCRLIFDEPPWASDHFGVMADLRPFDVAAGGCRLPG